MSLKQTIQVVERMLKDEIIKRYAIGGAVAALTYIEPTVTSDLDVLISVEEFETRASGLVVLTPIIKYLKNIGYDEFRDEGILVEGWPVQFLPVANDLDAEALSEAIEIDYPVDDGTVRAIVLRPEHLVATAIRVGRPKDYTRILAFLHQGAVDLDKLSAVLDRHNLRERWVKWCRQFDIPDGLSKEE